MKASRDRGRSFPFLRINEREPKPRKRGLTEIRGPYYSVIGRRYLEDLFDTMGAYVDSLKFAGGSFTLMPEQAVREIVDLCHAYDVLVSTGGFIERVLAQGGEAVRRYVAECKKLDFDIIEISAGFVSIPTDDWLRLIELVRKSGMKAKPKWEFNLARAAQPRPRNSRSKGRATRAGRLRRQSDFSTPAPRSSWSRAKALRKISIRGGWNVPARARDGKAYVRSRRPRSVRVVH